MIRWKTSPFYGAYGVDPKQFAATMGSFAVNAKTNSAKQFAQRSQISGTPSIIVNGKYLVKGKSFPDMLRIADHLIAARPRLTDPREAFPGREFPVHGPCAC